MSESELKPCPFCGFTAKLIWDIGWKATCNNCYATIRGTSWIDPRKVTAAWNTRAGGK